MSYDGWSEQELQEECSRRGLKTTGSKAVLVERLESNNSSLKAAVSHKHKAVSEEECSGRAATQYVPGSLKAVWAALSGGANASCVDENLSSPLICACHRQDDWVVAEDVVRAAVV
jgi:hypothetical protein